MEENGEDSANYDFEVDGGTTKLVPEFHGNYET